MTKTITTAAAGRRLIAQAASAGLTVTRTSKDCFLADGDDKARVTLTEIRRLIADAHLRAAHEEERAEALALADELRDQAAACGGNSQLRPPDHPESGGLQPLQGALGTPAQGGERLGSRGVQVGARYQATAPMSLRSCSTYKSAEYPSRLGSSRSTSPPVPVAVMASGCTPSTVERVGSQPRLRVACIPTIFQVTSSMRLASQKSTGRFMRPVPSARRCNRG
ncbi:hypothetical protein DAERI_050005 [Deinococcus aerius]|uniref:Uncharacterized protein n=1 Tax=Deinococcus aerius TaxID=200253 RepID=A0A2I9D4C7_9DEIO|nr:hypothetical protein [Deinococcus aerius]GBF05496.1 hypothetical protein DAERI_050005 [Deinococcus aerius]